MTEHRYPRRTITPDYLRAGAGLIVTILPLSAVPFTSVAGIILSLLVVLFAIFAGRTWVRSRTTVQLSDDGLAVSALRHNLLPWQGVTSVELRYFATKRDRSQGWMQLTLKDPATTLRLESALEGFESVAREAANAAARANLTLSPSTLENLRALDLPTDHLRERPQVVEESQ
jgi:hypothetical protein